MALLAIDAGTTSVRAFLFEHDGTTLGNAQLPLQQYFSNDAWVEHDAEEIWRKILKVCRDVLEQCHVSAKEIAGIGITNQRETTVMWDRHTGEPYHRAIVWQDRRTTSLCDELKQQGKEAIVQAKTGLLLDPYFSASKVQWLLDHVDGLRQKAEQGDCAFGTVDSFLLWKLTAGKVHATDASNASRTALFNIHEQTWDKELLALFNVPKAILPEVKDNSCLFGETDAELLGASVPVYGIAGDQQAALIGQTCLEAGDVKSTYGTGCFMVLNTGKSPVISKQRLLTTVAYRLAGKTTYALEGSIFMAGALVQWLRDQLGIITNASETGELAASVEDSCGVTLVPAFTGLGAPHWRPDMRGAMFGLTRETNKAHMTRAALEAICFQSRELLEALIAEDNISITNMRVDGGMVANRWLMQNLADTLNLNIQIPSNMETTALGAAFLAGLGAGVFNDLQAISRCWHQESQYKPNMAAEQRDKAWQQWQQALSYLL